MLTKSGKYLIFDVTDPSFLPGRRIPALFNEEYRKNGGTWFFQPADWDEDNAWGGMNISRLIGFPYPYSPAYTDPNAALADAEQWESTKAVRDKRDAAALAFIMDDTAVTFNLGEST